MAIAKPKGQVNKYDAELASFAKDISAKEERAASGGGNFISTKGGRLSFNGGEVPGSRMNVVVLDHVFANLFYDVDYNPDAPRSPRCYAFGHDEDALVPHTACDEPQAGACHGCPNNEWASAAKGKGKACKNVRRLAVVAEADLQDLNAAQLAYLHVPVTSVKAWAGYVQQVAATTKRPPFAVVTEISIVPDPKTQFKVQFKFVRELTAAEVPGAIAKHKEVKEAIGFPYPSSAEAEPVKPAGKKAAPSKFSKPTPKAPIKGARR